MTKAKAAVSVLWWIAVIGFSLFFLWTDVFPYLQGYRSPSFGSTFFRNQFFVVVHLVGGTAALLTGPFQFWPGFREKKYAASPFVGESISYWRGVGGLFSASIFPDQQMRTLQDFSFSNRGIVVDHPHNGLAGHQKATY